MNMAFSKFAVNFYYVRRHKDFLNIKYINTIDHSGHTLQQEPLPYELYFHF